MARVYHYGQKPVGSGHLQAYVMTQTNDYSFNAGDTAFTANPDITVCDNSTLVYGTPP